MQPRPSGKKSLVRPRSSSRSSHALLAKNFAMTAGAAVQVQAVGHGAGGARLQHQGELPLNQMYSDMQCQENTRETYSKCPAKVCCGHNLQGPFDCWEVDPIPMLPMHGNLTKPVSACSQGRLGALHTVCGQVVCTSASTLVCPNVHRTSPCIHATLKGTNPALLSGCA